MISCVSVLQTKLQPLLVLACWCGDRMEAGDRQGRATQLNCSPILESGLALLPESFYWQSLGVLLIPVSIAHPALQDIPFRELPGCEVAATSPDRVIKCGTFAHTPFWFPFSPAPAVYSLPLLNSVESVITGQLCVLKNPKLTLNG